MIFQYRTGKIGLKPFTREDLLKSSYFEWFHDPEVIRYNSHGILPMTKEKVEKYFQSFNNDDKIVFAIYALRLPEQWNLSKEQMKEQKRFCFHIGNVSIQNIDWINRSAEFAILIGEPDYYRKGIATQCCMFMIYHAFLKLNLKRLWAGTRDDNIGMRTVFHNLGFKEEGEFRNAILEYYPFNIVQYSILDKEVAWKNIQYEIEKEMHDEQRGETNQPDSRNQDQK
jgi:RimJ/RimL family protein N-acetyltransferase